MPNSLRVGLSVLTMGAMMGVGLTTSTSAAPYLKVYTPTSGAVATHGGTFLEIAQGDGSVLYASSGPFVKDSGLLSTSATYGCSGTAHSIARADYGSLGAWAYATGDSVSGYDASGSAAGYAAFYDLWTITDPAHAGQTGMVSFHIHVGGTITGWYLHPGVNGGAYWSVSLNDDPNYSIGSWDYATNQGRPGADFDINKMFVFGQPFDFQISLQVGASGWSDNSPSEAAYLSTASMTSFTVSDSDSNPVNDFTLIAASGQTYPVPEPAALALLLCGTLALVPRRRPQTT